MTTKLFGEPVQRVEDAKLVTGGAHFLDDLGHDALGAAFVRSPHAHARITDVDITGALEVDGLIAVYTHEDLTGPAGDRLPLLIPHPALTEPRTGYPLARDVVKHVGEPIVMVVATDRYVAEDAAERIVVTYEHLPPVVGVDNARRADRTVHDDVPDNVSAHMVQQVGDVDRAMAAAPNVLELDLEIQRSASMPMEGKGVYAQVGRRRGLDADVLLDPDVHRRTRCRRGPARAAPEQGRLHRADGGWRVRRQDHAPVAGGGHGAVGGPRAGP